MSKNENGISLIALIVTIVVLIIIAGISISQITSSEKDTIQEANNAKIVAEKESIIEKIEADLLSEKIISGEMPNRNKLVSIVTSKNYGTISGNILTTTDGGYEIELTEIVGWKDE